MSELKTRVAPALPENIRAEIRPYQTEGFHFLAYLTTNRFGGVLADDMGLGKTLQALAWIAWLRSGGSRWASVSPATVPAGILPGRRAGFPLAEKSGTKPATLEFRTALPNFRANPDGKLPPSAAGETPAATLPSLVVCPKSVMDNWRAEAERFYPGLRVRFWRGEPVEELSAAREVPT